MTAFLLFGNQKLLAQSLPYTNGFEAVDTSFILQKSGDTLAWRLANGGISSSRCLLSEFVTNSSGNSAVGYFAAKRLNLTAGHTYQVAFQSKVQYSSRRKIKLAINTSAKRDSATQIHDFGTLSASDTYQPYSTTFSVETSGQYYLIYYAENLHNHPECLWYTDDFAVTLVNTPPTTTLVEPTNNSWFNPDQSVGMAATVTDAENNVVKVEFYEGANKVAEDFTPNGLGIYTASYLPENGGALSLTAKVIDSFGTSATSNSRTINVRYLPQTAITNLTPYSTYYAGLQRVTATATDPDGSIQYVTFYVGEDSIGTDSTAPYEMYVPLVYDENEVHRYLYAKAVDNDGLMGSAAVRIDVLEGTCSLTTPNSLLRQTMCMGDSVELRSDGETGTTGFQWIYKSQPEGNWENIASTKPKIYAHQPGLPNFVDAIPSPGPAFGKESNPIPLGNNPGSCCEAGPRYVNVECMQNNNSTGGNEAYFTFTLQRACTNYVSFSPPTCATNAWEFTRPLRVEVSAIDFGVTGTLKYFNTEINPSDWEPAPGSFSNGVLNISISDLNILNPTDQAINFRLIVDANSPLASGNFAAKVNYRHYDQQSNGTSCCRMAVSEEQQDKPKAENENTQTTIKVVPNPGQNQIEVQTNGEWVQFKIVDVKGRIVTEGNAFSGNLLLLTQQLPNGLYRVILSNQKESRSANFQILK